MTKRAARASDIARATRPRARTINRKARFRRRVKTAFALTLLSGLTLAAIGLVSLMALFYKFSSEIPDMEGLTGDIKTPVATTIVSSDGVILGKLEVENRKPILLADVPKRVMDATIAIEDHRFYEHPGVDVQGIARAVFADLRGKTLSQGGSTLTQQLIRNLDQFGVSKEKKYSRKLREAMLALRMEQIYSKKEILQLYLNNIYYGAGAYGIQAASMTYFGKSAYKLNLAEAALLAGIPQRPSAFNPFDHRRAALKRRDEVLDRMQEYGYITPEEYRKAQEEKPRLMPRQKRLNFDFKAPYFTTYVLKDLIDRYGVDFVYSGLKIETTLNWKMQQRAEAVLENGLQSNAGRGANQGALVSLDNRTGYIRALVGGRSFRADQYNAVTQGKRQPGSSFKVFDYAAAFDTGEANLYSAFADEPIEYPNDPQHRVVKNYDGGYSYRSMNCLTAIEFSKNTIAVQVARKVGIRTVIDYAHKMGITSELAPYLPTALGASAVHPLDLASAYSVFPMRGSRCLPMAITRVTDAEGNLIEEHLPQIKTNLLKPDTIAQMDKALEAVVTSGTGTLARGSESNGLVENAHGKTGTTSDNRDAWFAGYTPELTSVIWVASVHRRVHGKITYAEMPGATGGHLCAPIWHDFMIQAVPEQRKFKPPSSLASAGVSAPSGPQTVAVKTDAPKPKRVWRKDPTTTPVDNVPPPPATAEATANPDAPVSEAPPANANNEANPPQTAPNVRPPAAQSAPDALLPEDAPPPPARSAPSRPETAASPPPAARLRASAPTTTLSVARPPSRSAAPARVTVHVCVDSGGLANEYCPAYKTEQVTPAQARRMRRCRLHKPPPGEG